MSPRFPPPIQVGARVAVVAPAGPIDLQAFQEGIAILEARYTPIWCSECLDRNGYFAGTDARRLRELQAALDDETVSAVIAARGGYGTSRILDQLDFDAVVRTPKWIVGSSDLTALLVHLYAEHGLVSIHGPMVSTLRKHKDTDITALMDLLEGRPWTPPKGLRPLFPGEARGPFIGGNLTLLAHLAGTLLPSFADGAILLIEDVGEAPYRLDRCLTQLKRAGILDRVGGVVVGAFTDCLPGPDGTTAFEVIAHNLEPLGIPVATRYPAAHGKRNHPFAHGAPVALQVEKQQARILSCPHLEGFPPP